MTDQEQSENSQLAESPLESRTAGTWQRVAAGIIDVIILIIMDGIMMSVIVITDANQYSVLGILIFTARVMEFLLYFPIMEGSRLNASVGKLILGIKVTDGEGNPITFLRAFARNAVKILFFFILPFVFFVATLFTTASSILVFLPFLTVTFGVLLTGVLMIALTRKNRCLHDFAAGTLAVKSR